MIVRIAAALIAAALIAAAAATIVALIGSVCVPAAGEGFVSLLQYLPRRPC
jgi:hypothetical protein